MPENPLHTLRRGRPVIAVTTGDPAGVGPEIVARLFASWRPRRSVALIVGAQKALTVFQRQLSGITRLKSDDVLSLRLDESVYWMDTECRARFPQGRDSRGGGQHAGRALDVALEMVASGAVAGIVTAPLSKRSLNLAGYRFDGHTEMLARRLKAPNCQMMMAYNDLRIVPLTRHVALRRVSSRLRSDKILTALQVVGGALRTDFGIEQPRMAVAALNPHAGEGGLFGDEERDIIEPAVRLARRKRLRVTGPVPADALFQHAGDGTFDAFVTMYHDQGLIPFKMKARRRGVNVTLGLPVVRTSVDHGVAYDIAGKGEAAFDSLKAAYRMAENLVRRRAAQTRGEQRGR